MERFGPWILHRRLGAGGMAEAFLARRADGSGGPVCVKRILPGLKDTPGFAAMFRDEIALTGSLRHDHIVAVTDSGDVDGVLWLAMEYMDGPPLAAVLAHTVREGTRSTIGQALEISRQLALGLNAAHKALAADGQPLGIVHRDVSPHNILFTRFGTLKLSDFGIARAEERLARTATGVMKGKLGYLAPEQITGDAVDHRADQFAAGIVLWETLCARRLFRGPELQVLEAVVGSDVPAPSRFREDVPPMVDALVGRMLKRDPAARFPTMGAVAAAIDGLLAAETSSSRALAPLVMIDDESSTMQIPRTRFTIDESARTAPAPSSASGLWSPPPAAGIDDATVEGDAVEEEPTAPAPRQERPTANVPASPLDEASGTVARPWPVAPRIGPSSSSPPAPAPAPSPSPAKGAPVPLRLEALPGSSWSRSATAAIVLVVSALTGAAGVGVGLQLGHKPPAPGVAVATAPPSVASPPVVPPPAPVVAPPPAPSAPTVIELEDSAAVEAVWEALRLQGRGTPCVTHLVALRAGMKREDFLRGAGLLIDACAQTVKSQAPAPAARQQEAAALTPLAPDARVLMVRGEYAEAAKLLKAVVDRNPKDARAHLQLGICYAQLRKDTLAKEHYGRFLELQPTGADADRVRKSLESL